jgi:hypothetical protein
MIVNRAIIQEIEENRRKFIPEDLKKYLIFTYSKEPFDKVYSEQDLYNNINRDLDDYKSGKLDILPKSLADRRKVEIEELKHLYYEKCHEIRGLSQYVDDLEQILLEHNIESDKMKENRIALISI